MDMAHLLPLKNTPMRSKPKFSYFVLLLTLLAGAVAACSKHYENCFQHGLTVGSLLKYQIGSNGNGGYFYTMSFTAGPEGNLAVEVQDGSYSHQYVVNSTCRTASGDHLPGPTGLPVWISPPERLKGAFVWETSSGVDWRSQGPATFHNRFALRIATDTGASAFYDPSGFFLGWEPQPNYQQLLVESNVSGLKPIAH